MSAKVARKPILRGVIDDSYRKQLQDIITEHSEALWSLQNATAGGSGTVTSVAVTGPAAGLTVSGSPITTSGTISLSLANDLSALEGLSSTGYAQRTGTDAWSLVSSTLTHWTEASNTAAPNSGTGATSWTALSSLADANAIVVPKGNGGFLLQIPDATATAGNGRGIYAVDLQINRTAAANVASGARSTIVAGNNNKASGNESAVLAGNGNVTSDTGAVVCGGHSNTASSVGAGCFAGGGSGAGNTASNSAAVVLGSQASTASGTYSAVCGGQGATASGNSAVTLGGATNVADGTNSVCMGNQANAMSLINSYVHACGRFGTGAWSQRVELVLRCETTDATQATLTSDGNTATTTNQLTLMNNSAFVVVGEVVARQNATGDTAAFKFEVAIRRGANAAATAVVAAASVTTIAADTNASTWALAVDADTTNGCLRIRFTGQAAKTIRTTCSLRATQTTL